MNCEPVAKHDFVATERLHEWGPVAGTQLGVTRNRDIQVSQVSPESFYIVYPADMWKGRPSHCFLQINRGFTVVLSSRTLTQQKGGLLIEIDRRARVRLQNGSRTHRTNFELEAVSDCFCLSSIGYNTNHVSRLENLPN